MNRYFLILIAPLVFVFAKETKIGFVESQRIFSEYQATAATNIEFNQFVDIYRDSALVLRNHIDNREAEFEAQKLMLSEEARLRKLDEIESLKKNYDDFLQTIFGKNGKIEQKNDELMTPVLKKINDAVAKVAEQEGFSIVLDLSEGVFYASSELDLTDLVIAELNLEYGPAIPPTGITKKTIAIFPFREKNSEAVDAELSQRCQDEVYNAAMAFTQKFEIVGKIDINTEMARRGLSRNIEDEQAISIALMRQCDYIVIGDVSKFTNKIEYTIILKDIQNNEIMKRNNTVTEDIRLFEAFKNDLIALLDKIQ